MTNLRWLFAPLICWLRGHRQHKMASYENGYSMWCERCGIAEFVFEPAIYLAPGETKTFGMTFDFPLQGKNDDR